MKRGEDNVVRRRDIIHPALFALYPILFVAVYNWSLVSLEQLVVPTSIVFIFALVFWLSVKITLKNTIKASVGTSVFLTFFFTYGRLYTAVQNLVVSGIDIGQHKYTFPFWLVVLLVSFYLLIRTRSDLRRLTEFLNVVAVTLVSITLVTAMYRSFSGLLVNARVTAETVDLEQGRQPDIYYIILDGCSRTDILKEIYDLDITEFNRRMAQKGFFIGYNSRSNYSQTHLSLASSLNFSYLDELVTRVSPESSNRLPLKLMIHNNRVVNSLKQRGYTFVAFETSIDYTDIKSADRYMTDRWSLSEFDNILLNTTPLPGLLNRVLSRSADFQYDSHRHSMLYALEHLEDIARDDAPTFTFVHIMACHPPFVFDEEGNPINPSQEFALLDGNFFVNQFGRDEYVNGYRKQLVFILTRVEEAMDGVLAASSEPPIIVVQGDHGGGSGLNFSSLEETDLQERLSIFNIYYLPDGGDELLYDGITPVNTFRVILNQYFDADLGLLEDRSFYSPIEFPYRFTDVTDYVR